MPKHHPDSIATSAQLSSGRTWLETTGAGDLRTGSFGITGVGLNSSALAPDSSTGSAFDVCHVGVVLRAVLYVHAVVAVVMLFSAQNLDGYLLRFGVAVTVTLPAIIAWLVVACSLKRPLSRLPAWAQWLFAVGLGALAAHLGYEMLHWTGVGQLGLLGDFHWAAAASAGGMLAAALFHWLTLRAATRVPAETTARLAELQSRIRPHFLFNTLNTAIALARLDPAQTESLLEDLAELFRVALNDGGQPVSLTDEVVLAQRYLAIEQLRFGDRLQVIWELEEAAGGAQVPSLLLQPLVENAVRHGVEPSPQGGVVRVRTRVRRGHAHITVVNTVPDRPSQPGSGIALRNVRDRLKLMHDVAARFEVRSSAEFFRVEMVVPL